MVPDSLGALDEQDVSRTLHVERWGDPRGATRGLPARRHGARRRLAAARRDPPPGFHVLAPDLIGHGSSPYEPPWSIAEHIDSLLATLGEEPSVWIGHSFGGRLAFELAVRRPDAVERLVLLDPALQIDPQIALYVAEDGRKDRSFASFDEGIDRRFDESFLSRASREVVAGDLAGYLVESDDGRWRYRYSQSAVIAAYGEMSSAPPPFTSPAIPTLVVLGADSYVPYDHLRGRPPRGARRPARGRDRARRAHPPLGRLRGDRRGDRRLPRLLLNRTGPRGEPPVLPGQRPDTTQEDSTTMDWTSDGTTRAAFLSRGAKGGLALVAGGSVLAATTGTAFGAATTDTDIAKLAATAELLAIDFYTRALGSKRFTGAEEAYMAAALQNEKDHYKALAGVLKSAAPKGLRFAYPRRHVREREEHRHARPGARDGVRRRLPRGRHGAEVERPQGRRGDDRRQRVAPPGDPLEHRGGHDRLRARRSRRRSPRRRRRRP